MATAKKTATATAKPSTAVAVKKSSAVVSLKEQLAAQAAAMSKRVAAPTGNTISTAGKKFKLPDGRRSGDPIEVVVLDFVSSNQYYDRDYDADNPCPPACFALGDDPRELVPSDNSPAKQSEDCQSCPMNQFGTAKTGGGKACTNGRLLAVVPPDAHEETPIWLLRVSPSSLKSFDGFVRSTASSLALPPVGVVVTVSFDDNVDYPKLEFSNPVPNDNLEVHVARQAEARELLTTEPDVSTYAPVAPPKSKGPARAGARR